MPTLTIERDKIFELVDQLQIEEKIEIFERLKPQVLADRWADLFNRIDQQKQSFPISDDEIEQEVERARDEYATRRR